MGTLDNGLKREWLRLTAENARLRAALGRVRNALNAHNRPDHPLPNEKRLALRDICDLALESEANGQVTTGDDNGKR